MTEPPEHDSSRGSLGRLLALLKGHGRRVLLAALLSVGAVIGLVVTPLLVGHAVNEIESGDKDGLVLTGIALLAAPALAAISQGLRQRIAGHVSVIVEYELRGRYFGHLQDVGLGFLQKQPLGQLLSRGTVDIAQIKNFLGPGVSSLAQDFGTLLLSSVAMFILDPDLAAITLANGPILIVAAVLYQRRAVPLLKETRRRIGVLATIADENIRAVRLIRAFVRERIAIERYHRAASQMVEAAMRAVRLESIYTPTMVLIPNLGLVSVLLYGGYQTLNGHISVGEFATFYTYVLMLVDPAGRIAYWMVLVQEAMAGEQRVDEILSDPVEEAPGGGTLPPGPAEVSLEDATMSYPGTAPVLDGVDLRVPPAGSVAIVGPTGSGKSSLLMLVNRLYDARSGVVAVDGTPVRDLDLAALRHGSAAAVDDDYLFPWSVRDNIAYGRPEATDEEVRDAARRARAHEFIERLPQGYETPVGSGGSGLSGGQRERIAVARALLVAPRILLLDNATGSLDAGTEAGVLGELSERLHDCTTLIVAYRASSLAIADRVVVLDRGRIVAEGTHTELLAGNPEYRRLIGHGDGGEGS